MGMGITEQDTGSKSFDKVEEAWTNPGPAPWYHEYVKEQLARMWPSLYKALQEKYDAKLCMSRGPRIGNDGVPYCKLPKGHTSPYHRPAESDGWGKDIFWFELGYDL